MKKLILLLTVALITFSCSSESDNPSDNPSVSETNFIFENSSYNGSVLVSYTDGTKQNVIFTNGKSAIPVSSSGNKRIASIQPENEQFILIGRQEGTSIHLNYNNGVLSHRIGLNGFTPVGCYAELQLINANVNTLKGTYLLEYDLDLMGVQWTPIGSTSLPFKGNFDGRNHEIQNIFVNTTENGGLFGFATNYPSTQYIKNLIVSSGSITGGYVAGGIIANIGASNITNCQNYATIEANSVGGIVGRSGSTEGYRTTITNCQNYGIIFSREMNAGGITYESYKITDCQNYGIINSAEVMNSGQYYSFSGGIAGRAEIINNCSNHGGISNRSNKAVTIGGICGTTYGVISNCYNTNGASSYVIGSSMGGIVGQMLYSTNTKIVACFNTGYIGGNGSVGGIVGFWHCDKNGIIEACYNTGELYNASPRGTFPEANIGIGGIVGSARNANTSNIIKCCYNIGKLICTEYWDGLSPSGGIVGHTFGPNNLTTNNCFWKNISNDGVEYAIGQINTTYNINTGANLFDSSSWPTLSESWFIGNGTNEAYWKSLGSWNNGNPIYPKLHYEN